VILVDTSVWIDHLRAGNAVLERLLDRGGVLAHLAGRRYPRVSSCSRT